MTLANSVVAVDFHCHLDLYPDHVAAVMAAEAAKIYTLSVTTTPLAWPRNRDLTEGLKYVRAALGFHPQLVAERMSELSTWERYLPETRYVGEVGLDASPRFYKSLEIQKSVFRLILENCAKAGDKILTVHSVRCTSTALDMIEKHLPPKRGKVVLHWFTGSNSEARRAVEMGCFFSINSNMMNTDRGKSLIGNFPWDRILTETDGPFTSINGRPACPADVLDTLKLIACLRGMTTMDVKNIIYHNLACLIS